MPIDPKTIRWISVGTDAAPTGVSVPKENLDSVRAAVAAALPSPEPPAPAWKPRKRYIPAPGERDGPSFRGQMQGAALTDTLVDGLEQNVIFEKCGPSVVSNVVSCNAHPKDPFGDGQKFRGQSLYVDECPSLIVSGFAGLFGGWQKGLPPRARQGYRHNLYANWGLKRLVVEDSVLWGASAMGAQARQWQGDAVFRRCVLIDNGCGVMPVAGYVTLDGVTIFGGHGWAERTKDGEEVWTGNMALSSYTATTLKDVWCVGAVGQDKPPDNRKQFNLGCVVGSRVYQPAHDLVASGYLPKAAIPKGASWNVSGDCRIVGWPGPPFGGDAPPSPGDWKVGGNPLDPAKLPLARWLAALTQSDRPVADVAAEMRDAIRSAAGAA